MIFIRNSRFFHEFCTKFQVNLGQIQNVSNSRFFGHPDNDLDSIILALQKNILIYKDIAINLCHNYTTQNDNILTYVFRFIFQAVFYFLLFIFHLRFSCLLFRCQLLQNLLLKVFRMIKFISNLKCFYIILLHQKNKLQKVTTSP